VGRKLEPGDQLTGKAGEGYAALELASKYQISRFVLTHRKTRHQFELGPIESGQSRQLLALPEADWCVELVMLGQADLYVSEPPCFTVVAERASYAGAFNVTPTHYEYANRRTGWETVFEEQFPGLKFSTGDSKRPQGPREPDEVNDPDE